MDMSTVQGTSRNCCVFVLKMTDSHGYKIKRLVVALRIIFVLKLSRSRDGATVGLRAMSSYVIPVNEYDQRRSFANDETVRCTVSQIFFAALIN